MNDLTKKDILEKLKIDEHYYGEFGQQFRSNSDISTLLKNPLALNKSQGTNINFLVGGYFHTAILEPDKLKNFKIIESTATTCGKLNDSTGSIIIHL